MTSHFLTIAKKTVGPLVGSFIAVSGALLGAAPARADDTKNAADSCLPNSTFLSFDGVAGNKVVGVDGGYYNNGTLQHKLDPYGSITVGSNFGLGQVGSTGICMNLAPIATVQSPINASMPTPDYGVMKDALGVTPFVGGQYGAYKQFGDYRLGAFTSFQVDLFPTRDNWLTSTGLKGSTNGYGTTLAKLGVSLGRGNWDISAAYFVENLKYASTPNGPYQGSGAAIKGFLGTLTYNFR